MLYVAKGLTRVCVCVCVWSSEQLDAIAQKKLVNFVHDLMTQYFDFVRRRVQLEVHCVEFTVLFTEPMKVFSPSH